MTASVTGESAAAPPAPDAAATFSGFDGLRGAPSRPPSPAPRSFARPPLACPSTPLAATVGGASAVTGRAPPTTPAGRTAPDPETSSSPPCAGVPASAAAVAPVVAAEAMADSAAAVVPPPEAPPPPPPSPVGLPPPGPLTRPLPPVVGACAPVPPPMRPSNAGSGSYESGMVDPPLPSAAAATRSAAASAADGVAAAGAYAAPVRRARLAVAPGTVRSTWARKSGREGSHGKTMSKKKGAPREKQIGARYKHVQGIETTPRRVSHLATTRPASATQQVNGGTTVRLPPPPTQPPDNAPASACIRIATTATGATTIMAQ